MSKNVQVCFLILILLHSYTWSCSGPATPTYSTTSKSPMMNTTMETSVPAEDRSTIIRQFDVEVNSYCSGDGSTAAHPKRAYLEIDAHSNFGSGCGQQYTRSLIAFRKLDLLPLNPPMKSARIKLYGYNSDSFQAYSLTEEHDVTNEVLIKRILTKWDANTVTWETQPNTTNANAAVIPSTKPTLPVIAVNTILYNFTIDITKLVRDIQANGPGNNHGFMLQMKYERRYRAMAFCSFYHEDMQRHPEIIIDI